MVETKTKIIDGREIEVVQFPARRAFKLKIKLLKYLSPLSSLFKSNLKSNYFNSDKSLLDSDIEIDLGGVSNFIDKLGEDEFLNFVLLLMSSTRIDGKEISEEVFDLEFTGKMSLVYKIVFFIIEVNYPDFFGEGGIGKILSKSVNPVPPKQEELKK